MILGTSDLLGHNCLLLVVWPSIPQLIRLLIMSRECVPCHRLLSVGSVAAHVDDVRGAGCGRDSYSPYSALGFSSKIFWVTTGSRSPRAPKVRSASSSTDMS